MTNAVRKTEPWAAITPAVSFDDGQRYTYADYKKWDDTVRRELISGRVYMMSAPTGGHQGISMEASRQFANYLRGKPCRVFSAPYDVRLFASPEGADDESDRDIVQPDISIICDRKKRRPDGCHGAPDLIVEILSESNRSPDMLLKFNKYLEAGVREYWVIDPAEKILMVHTLDEKPEGNQYYTTVYESAAKVKAGVLENCVIDLADVFAAGAEEAS
ncbi:MAG: Uma2 family endonuclease [Treponema sp.]|jgi:Uma2 family endonuclease|nr:Uma2 family endonuclease [Treponema sp.]